MLGGAMVMSSDEMRRLVPLASDPTADGDWLFRLYDQIQADRMAAEEEQDETIGDAFNRDVAPLLEAILTNPAMPGAIYHRVKEFRDWKIVVRNPGLELEMLVDPSIQRVLADIEARWMNTSLLRHGIWPMETAKEVVRIAQRHGTGNACLNDFFATILRVDDEVGPAGPTSDFYAAWAYTDDATTDELFSYAEDSDHMQEPVEVIEGIVHVAREHIYQPLAFYHEIGPLLLRTGKAKKAHRPLAYEPAVPFGLVLEPAVAQPPVVAALVDAGRHGHLRRGARAAPGEGAVRRATVDHPGPRRRHHHEAPPVGRVRSEARGVPIGVVHGAGRGVVEPHQLARVGAAVEPLDVDLPRVAVLEGVGVAGAAAGWPRRVASLLVGRRSSLAVLLEAQGVVDSLDAQAGVVAVGALRARLGPVGVAAEPRVGLVGGLDQKAADAAARHEASPASSKSGIRGG